MVRRGRASPDVTAVHDGSERHLGGFACVLSGTVVRRLVA